MLSSSSSASALLSSSSSSSAFAANNDDGGEVLIPVSSTSTASSSSSTALVTPAASNSKKRKVSKIISRNGCENVVTVEGKTIFFHIEFQKLFVEHERSIREGDSSINSSRNIDITENRDGTNSLLITSEFDRTTSEALTEIQRGILAGDCKGQSYGQFLDEGARQEANIAALCEGQVEGRAIKAMSEMVLKHLAGILDYLTMYFYSTIFYAVL
jgi:hypothetical protein